MTFNKKVKELDCADFSLVTFDVNGYPACVKHGAMNKVSNCVWRCCATYAVKEVDIGRRVPNIDFVDNNCRAGCVEEEKL